jgi:hypothetical protein
MLANFADFRGRRGAAGGAGGCATPVNMYLEVINFTTPPHRSELKLISRVGV